MPRAPRPQFRGALYHITTRGNNSAAIFLDDRDREVFLALLALVVKALGWRCHAFCLMGNHFHLLMETPNGDVARGMRALNGQFARGFNRRHGRRGHLFERRYHEAVIERQEHLLEACRYVVLNPVRAGLCGRAEDWPWSSYAPRLGSCRRLRSSPSRGCKRSSPPIPRSAEGTTSLSWSRGAPSCR